MRLINKYPILRYNCYNFPHQHFGLFKDFCALGERLKSVEQRLCFLKRCKRNSIFPPCIDNNIRANINILFTDTPPIQFTNTITSLKVLALNRMIWSHYRNISSLKYNIMSTKNNLRLAINDHGIFSRIVSIFETNNLHIKASEKERLQSKYQWINRKFLPPTSDTTCHDNSTIAIQREESVSERVTAIHTELSSEEESLLALGPNFAVTPIINEGFMDDVRVEIASCAYKLRWSLQMQNTHSCPTQCSVLRQKGVPFNKPFARPPPTNNTDTEDELRNLSKFVMHLISNTKVKYNLSHDQAVGLKSLLRKRDTYHFSVSDKGGEFVVMDKEKQRLLTEYHIRTSTGVYRYIPPTRTYSGVPRDIAAPTEVSFNRQIKSKTELLETQCNTLWKTICDRRNVPIDLRDMFLSRHTNLPTLYVLIKTHKFSIEDVINPDDIQTKCKVRPIVSCCSSPTEKLAWLCTEILSPLLNRVPSHLNNIYAHLDILRSLPPDELLGLKFCTADISSLYTNINIQQSVDDVIEFAAENEDCFRFIGIKISGRS